VGLAGIPVGLVDVATLGLAQRSLAIAASSCRNVVLDWYGVRTGIHEPQSERLDGLQLETLAQTPSGSTEGAQLSSLGLRDPEGSKVGWQNVLSCQKHPYLLFHTGQDQRKGSAQTHL